MTIQLASVRSFNLQSFVLQRVLVFSPSFCSTSWSLFFSMGYYSLSLLFSFLLFSIKNAFSIQLEGFNLLSVDLPAVSSLEWNLRARKKDWKRELVEGRMTGQPTPGQPVVLPLVSRLEPFTRPASRTNRLEGITLTTDSISEKCPWKIECFLEDLFLGSQGSAFLVIDGYLLNPWAFWTIGT